MREVQREGNGKEIPSNQGLTCTGATRGAGHRPVSLDVLGAESRFNGDNGALKLGEVVGYREVLG